MVPLTAGAVKGCRKFVVNGVNKIVIDNKRKPKKTENSLVFTL